MKWRPQIDIRWILILWLFVLSAVAYLDRVNLSVAGTKLAQEFSISNVRLGLIFSSFLVGYALFQTPAGWLADRFGARRILTVGVLWWGVFSALTALIPHSIGNAFLALVFIRFLLGAGEAVMYPAANLFVARWIPTQERGVANGIIFAGVGIGAGITPPLISYTMLHWGWRPCFFISALVGLAAGAVWFLASRDTPETHPFVSPSELSFIQQGIPQGAPGKTDRAELLSWPAILTSRNVWALSVSYYCFGYVAWIFFGWFFIYLAQVRGLDLKSSGLYASLPFLAMAVSSPAGGVICDWMSKRFGARVGRCATPVASFALTAIFVVLGSVAKDTRIATLVLAGGAGSLYFSQSSFWAVSADLGGKSSGSLSSFMNMAGQIGGAVTLSLTPLLARVFGWSVGFHAAAAVAALGAVAWLFVDPHATLSLSLRRTLSAESPASGAPQSAETRETA
jgi:ACS family glucarate transporter-like MFS transporter